MNNVVLLSQNKYLKLNNNSNLRWINLFYCLLCAIITYFNDLLGLVLALMGGFILIKRFGLIEFMACSAILLVKSQNSDVLDSQDLESHIKTFALIAGDNINILSGFDQYGSGEIILPFIFWIFGNIFDTGNANVFAFMFVLSFLLFYYYFIKGLKVPPVVLLFTVLLVDVELIVHLYRQSMAAIILLVALLPIINNKNMNLKNYCLIIITFLLHFANLIFAPIAFIFSKIPLPILKMATLLGVAFIYIGQGRGLYVDFLMLAHGMPVIGKAAFALQVFEGEAGIRMLALIGIFSALLIKQNITIIKLFLGFGILMLFLYDVPILSTRVGYISTSLITGLPIGYLALEIRNKVCKNSIINSRIDRYRRI